MALQRDPWTLAGIILIDGIRYVWFFIWPFINFSGKNHWLLINAPTKSLGEFNNLVSKSIVDCFLLEKGSLPHVNILFYFSIHIPNFIFETMKCYACLVVTVACSSIKINYYTLVCWYVGPMYAAGFLTLTSSVHLFKR